METLTSQQSRPQPTVLPLQVTVQQQLGVGQSWLLAKLNAADSYSFFLGTSTIDVVPLRVCLQGAGMGTKMPLEYGLLAWQMCSPSRSKCRPST